MEITFQNKREDFEAFYDYMVRETEQGKKLSKRAFLQSVIWTVVVALLLGAFQWGFSGQWQAGLRLTIICLVGGAFLNLFMQGFKPIYGAGILVYRNQNSGITEKQKALFELPRTISIDDHWLEIRSSEVLHRWRWRQVDKIGIMPDFIFVHVSNCPVIYVPKRDFPSEQSFFEFGNRLAALSEKHKDQRIGSE